MTHIDGSVKKDVSSMLKHWSYVFLLLTHRTLWVCKLGLYWYRQYFAVCLMPNHYLTQCWLLANLNQNKTIFVYKNWCQNIFCKRAVVLWKFHWVKRVQKSKWKKGVNLSVISLSVNLPVYSKWQMKDPDWRLLKPHQVQFSLGDIQGFIKVTFRW